MELAITILLAIPALIIHKLFIKPILHHFLCYLDRPKPLLSMGLFCIISVFNENANRFRLVVFWILGIIIRGLINASLDA